MIFSLVILWIVCDFDFVWIFNKICRIDIDYLRFKHNTLKSH